MSRIKRGTIASKRRKKVLKAAKGFKWRRKTNYRAAKEALIKAGKYAYRDRRNKKRFMRRLWILRLNNAVKEYGINYSTFINTLKKEKIELNRKVLSEIAIKYPDVFKNFMKTILKNK